MGLLIIAASSHLLAKNQNVLFFKLPLGDQDVTTHVQWAVQCAYLLTMGPTRVKEKMTEMSLCCNKCINIFL